MNDSISISGMEFYGRHGVLAEENALGQRFVVDIKLYIDLQKAGKTDDLNDTVNYAQVYDCVKRIVEGEPVKLLESLAARIIQSVLNEFSQIEGVKITLHKPGAPIQGIFKDVKVQIKRERKDYAL
ncbi:MAG: dihydroneopterin aldolase [Anaerovibrio sp.]|nr:dihydroneopterin aldolase [Anaerovibrio sp.]